jgi:glycosyltransferase involved in cell wall biosynthesis
MKISLIISTCNREESLTDCLDSIFKQTLIPYEIIIVDSSDEFRKPCIEKNCPSNIKYLHTQSRGLTKQRNIGLKEASGDIVTFVDDDVILYRNYLEEIQKVFDNYPGKIGGVTGKVIDTNEEITGVPRLCYHIFAWAFLLLRPGSGRFQLSGFPTSYRDKGKVVKGEILYGCNMAFKREVLMEIGFDEKLYRFMYMEDESIAYRVSRKYNNYFTPFAIVIHRNREKRNEWIRANALVRNFIYLHRTMYPRTTLHIIAFLWSMCGLSFVEFMRSIKRKDMSRFKGFLTGIVQSLET